MRQLQCFITSHKSSFGLQVEVPAAHLAACLLCNQTTGDCVAEGGAGAGQGAELLLYVSSALSPLCRESATLSHAGHCSQVTQLLVTDSHAVVTLVSHTVPQDPGTDRPVAGHVNICPNNLDTSPRELTENIKHEILHILGFSVKLFAFFRTRAGKPRWGSPSLAT